MNIYINNNKVTGKSLFKTIWLGWVIGVSTIFIPIFIFAGFSAGPALFKEDPNPFMFALIIPIVVALQGVFIGAVILLGLKLLPNKYNENKNT